MDPQSGGNIPRRGYLRCICEIYWRFPEEEVLAAYYELGLEAPRKDAMQSFSRRTKQQTADSRLMILTYVIAAIILASVVLFAWQQANHEDERATQLPQRSLENDPAEAFSDEAQAEQTSENEWIDETPQDETEVQEASPQQQVPEPTVTETQTNSESPIEGEITLENEPAAEITPAVDESVVEEEPAPNASVENASIDDVDPNAGDLVFYFRGDCWVRIDDASGENIAGGVKRTGYIMPLNGEAPYSIQLGAPDLVEMWYRGERVDYEVSSSSKVVSLDLHGQCRGKNEAADNTKVSTKK